MHEVTHAIETKEISDLILDYASKNPEFNQALKSLQETYGTEKVSSEVVADISGQLFGNQEFINNLSTSKPSIFKRIYDAIISIANKITGNNNEALFIKDLQNKWEKAYRTQNNNLNSQQYSQIENFTDLGYNIDGTPVQPGDLINEFRNLLNHTEWNKYNRSITSKIKEHGQNFDTIDNINGKIIYTEVINGKEQIFAVQNTKTKEVANEFIKFAKEVMNENNSREIQEIISNVFGEELLSEYDFSNYNIDDSNGLSKRIDGENNSRNEQKNRSRDFKSNTSSLQENNKELDNSSFNLNENTKYSLSENTGKMVDNKGNEVTLETSDAGTRGTLMAIHNLSADKLRAILELGGFPVPSIAITNQIHNQFGNISVLFDKSTIDPANKKNEVYDRDVWSPTFPTVEYDVNNDAIKKMIKSKNIYSNYQDTISGDVNNRYLEADNLRDMVDRYGIEETLNNLKDSDKLKYVYLKSVGDFQPATKTAKFSNYYSNETLQRFLENYQGMTDFSWNTPLNELSYEQIMALEDRIKEIIKPELEQEAQQFKNSDKEYIRKYGERYVEEELSKVGYSRLDNFIYSAIQLEKMGNNHQIIDEDATLKKAKDSVNQEEFNKWVDDTFGEVLNNAEKGIRNDKDIFTLSGNRRSFKQLHYSYNLQNIVKYMISQSTVGGQNTLFEGGFGKTSAQLSKKFSSIDDIKQSESRITTREGAEEVIIPLKEKLDSDMQKLLEYRKTGNYKSDFVNSLEGFEQISGAVEEFAGKKNLTTDNFKKVLDSYYTFETNKIPNEILQDIIDDLNAIKNIPTDYFEAKPQRVVGLDEVQAVVIPNDTDVSLKQELQEKGLYVVEYDPNIESDKATKINSFDNLKFSLSNNNQSWQEHLEKNYKSTGTKTDMNNIKLPGIQKAMNQEINKALLPLKKEVETLNKNINYEVSKSTEAGYVPSIYIKDADGDVIYRIANHDNGYIDDFDMVYNDSYNTLFTDKEYANWKEYIIPKIEKSTDLILEGNRTSDSSSSLDKNAKRFEDINKEKALFSALVYNFVYFFFHFKILKILNIIIIIIYFTI